MIPPGLTIGAAEWYDTHLRQPDAITAPTAARAQVITLCGSARFERLFKAWNEALTMAGHTVFTLTAYPSDKAGVKLWYSDEQKMALDAAHFRKIEASDSIFVLNQHAYIGESTLREVEHARRLGKTVYFLESWGKGNGIGSGHTDAARRAVEADGLTLPTASPIDTTTRSGARDPWGSQLLGPAGELRSAIVELTKNAAQAAAQDRDRLHALSEKWGTEDAASTPAPAHTLPVAREEVQADMLHGVDALLNEAYAHWDADREFKVGKILLALIGLNKGYDKRSDAFRAALAHAAPAGEKGGA